MSRGVRCAACGETERFHHEAHLTDICECGDYRRNHEDLTGRCMLANNLVHGFQPCKSFRLSRVHHEFEAAPK